MGPAHTEHRWERACFVQIILDLPEEDEPSTMPSEENVAEEMASGGLLRVPQPAYFSAGGLSDQIAMASAFSNMIPIPIVISKLETIPTPVAINTGGGTKVAYMSSISTRRL